MPLNERARHSPKFIFGRVAALDATALHGRGRRRRLRARLISPTLACVDRSSFSRRRGRVRVRRVSLRNARHRRLTPREGPFTTRATIESHHGQVLLDTLRGGRRRAHRRVVARRGALCMPCHIRITPLHHSDVTVGRSLVVAALRAVTARGGGRHRDRRRRADGARAALARSHVIVVALPRASLRRHRGRQRRHSQRRRRR